MTLAAIQKLKKRIRELERKEAQSRKKLTRAMLQAEKLASVYKSRLKSAVRQAKLKNAFKTALAYARAACKMEDSMLKHAEERSKAVMSAIFKMDKDDIFKTVKRVKKAVKGKKK